MRRAVPTFAISAIFAAGVVTGCSAGAGGGGGGLDGGAPQDGEVSLSGAVEKGPFVLGSSISVSPLDAEGRFTGSQFKTQTINDLGEFRVDFVGGGYVSIEGEGFYFNEVTGALSGANLTLRAFYPIPSEGTQEVYLNLLTHLTYLRVQALLREGTAGPDAQAQAERELRAALPVGVPDLTVSAPATSLSLQGGDTDGNAYLLAVSAVFAEAGRRRGSVDAGLQELLNVVAADLADDGALQPALVEELREAQSPRWTQSDGSVVAGLDPDAVMENLATRFADVGLNAEVPDLHRILDVDFDGVVNAEDNCWWETNADQADADGDGYGDACAPVWTDPTTGLSWTAPTPFHEAAGFEGTWAEADAYCAGLELGGRADWRLPSIEALRTLFSACPDMAPGGACRLSSTCPTILEAAPETGCTDHCVSCADLPERFQGSRTWSASRFFEADLGGGRTDEAVLLAEGRFEAAPLDTSLPVRCVAGTSAVLPEVRCSDALDGDGDGLTDCADPDCARIPAAPGACTDDVSRERLYDDAFEMTCGLSSSAQSTEPCRLLRTACGACYADRNACFQAECAATCGDPAGAGCVDCAASRCGDALDVCFGAYACGFEGRCLDAMDDDGDGLTDLEDPDCEGVQGGGGSGDPDQDADSVPDAYDNCPATFNPEQQDQDGDGIGDVCDPDTDADRDGVPNASDNCPLVSNPAQTDTDGDGVGDACETAIDTDGDGVPDDDDNCPEVENPDQTDTDGDGVGDACESGGTCAECPEGEGTFCAAEAPPTCGEIFSSGAPSELSVAAIASGACTFEYTAHLPDGSQVPLGQGGCTVMLNTDVQGSACMLRGSAGGELTLDCGGGRCVLRFIPLCGGP